MNGVGLWTFGRQVHTEAQAHLSLRGRYQVGPFCSFCSFFLSFFVCCTIPFTTTTCFQAILRTTIESPSPLIPARSVPSCAFLFFLSFFVCCTIPFTTTTCFQAILQTSVEINLPIFGRPKITILSFSIYTQVLNLETY